MTTNDVAVPIAIPFRKSRREMRRSIPSSRASFGSMLPILLSRAIADAPVYPVPSSLSTLQLLQTEARTSPRSRRAAVGREARRIRLAGEGALERRRRVHPQENRFIVRRVVPAVPDRAFEP